MQALSLIMIEGTSTTSNLRKPMKSPDQYDSGRPPDDVFETPLFKMERRGRFLTIQTDRTPEQQADIDTNIVNNRHKLLERAVEIRDELRDLLHRFTSLDLLAHQIAQDILQDPNSYQEIDTNLRPHLIEYLALLELEDAAYTVKFPVYPQPQDVEKTRQLLEELFDCFKWQIMTEHVSEGQSSVPSVSQEMRFHSVMYHVFVRSPAYHDHWIEILEPLFSSPRVSAWLASHNLNIADVLKCIDWLGGLVYRRITDRLRAAKKEEVKLLEQIKKVRQGIAPDVELPEIFLQAVKENGKNRRKIIEAALSHWAFFAIGTTMTVTAKDLSEYAEVPEASAKAFLDCFSLEFGQPEVTDPWPHATHPLQTKPIIRYNNDSYFLAAPHLLAWSIKLNFEARLRSEPGAPWKNYEEHRAKLVIQKAIEYLSTVMPLNENYEELYYTFEGNRYELDGLFIFDRYVLLMEAKAGSVSDASRRGATKSLESDLKALVRNPSRQAARAKKYIESTAQPTFITKDSQQAVIDKSTPLQVVTMALTLDNLAMFTSDMSSIKQMGFLTPDSISWTLYLPDLKIITELLPQPSQFWHYFRWRRSLFGMNNIFGADEVNWLGIYIKQGPSDVRQAPESYRLTFTSYTTEMDDYFLYRAGQRSKAAPRPKQEIPGPMEQLIHDTERTATLGFTAVTELLLDLTFRERRKFAALLRKHEKTSISVRLFETPHLSIEILSDSGHRECSDRALALASASKKPAVTLSLRSRSISSISWSFAAPNY
jgi:hypothetical protein